MVLPESGDKLLLRPAMSNSAANPSVHPPVIVTSLSVCLSVSLCVCMTAHVLPVLFYQSLYDSHKLVCVSVGLPVHLLVFVFTPVL